jgi:lipopolysaccharide transport system ATP-binding protein
VDGALRDKLICDIEQLPLLPGRYRLHVNVATAAENQDSLDAAAVFDVEEGLYDGRRERATPYGVFTASHHWTTPVDAAAS